MVVGRVVSYKKRFFLVCLTLHRRETSKKEKEKPRKARFLLKENDLKQYFSWFFMVFSTVSFPFSSFFSLFCWLRWFSYPGVRRAAEATSPTRVTWASPCGQS